MIPPHPLHDGIDKAVNSLASQARNRDHSGISKAQSTTRLSRRSTCLPLRSPFVGELQHPAGVNHAHYHVGPLHRLLRSFDALSFHRVCRLPQTRSVDDVEGKAA